MLPKNKRNTIAVQSKIKANTPNSIFTKKNLLVYSLLILNSIMIAPYAFAQKTQQTNLEKTVGTSKVIKKKNQQSLNSLYNHCLELSDFLLDSTENPEVTVNIHPSHNYYADKFKKSRTVFALDNSGQIVGLEIPSNKTTKCEKFGFVYNKKDFTFEYDCTGQEKKYVVNFKSGKYTIITELTSSTVDIKKVIRSPIEVSVKTTLVQSHPETQAGPSINKGDSAIPYYKNIENMVGALPDYEDIENMNAKEIKYHYIQKVNDNCIFHIYDKNGNGVIDEDDEYKGNVKKNKNNIYKKLQKTILKKIKEEKKIN